LQVFIQPPPGSINNRRISERLLSLFVHLSVAVFCRGLIAFSPEAWGTGKGEIQETIEPPREQVMCSMAKGTFFLTVGALPPVSF
jgi:hypothetical protein